MFSPRVVLALLGERHNRQFQIYNMQFNVRLLRASESSGLHCRSVRDRVQYNTQKGKSITTQPQPRKIKDLNIRLDDQEATAEGEVAL